MSANCLRLKNWEGIGRNAEFVMENLLASRLGSQSQLPWTLIHSLRYLSFWNGKPRVCLISGLPNSGFSLNPLSGMPPRSLLGLDHGSVLLAFISKRATKFAFYFLNALCQQKKDFKLPCIPCVGNFHPYCEYFQLQVGDQYIMAVSFSGMCSMEWFSLLINYLLKRQTMPQYHLEIVQNCILFGLDLV